MINHRRTLLINVIASFFHNFHWFYGSNTQPFCPGDWTGSVQLVLGLHLTSDFNPKPGAGAAGTIQPCGGEWVATLPHKQRDLDLALQEQGMLCPTGRMDVAQP